MWYISWPSLTLTVFDALLRNPFSWDCELKDNTSCETVLPRNVETRPGLKASDGLEKLRLGFVRRQW
jgi:capsular polysaccharide export protein